MHSNKSPKKIAILKTIFTFVAFLKYARQKGGITSVWSASVAKLCRPTYYLYRILCHIYFASEVHYIGVTFSLKTLKKSYISK